MMAPEVLLDQAIDDLLAGRGASLDPDGPLAAAVALLDAPVPPSPRRADIRRSMLTTVLETKPRHRRMRWLVVAPSIALVAFGGVAFAARSARPGSPLYGIRRGMQAVQLAVTFGNHDKAVALLDRAQRDLDDAASLVSSGDLRDARSALRHFRLDLASARSEINLLARDDRATLKARADEMQARAADLEAAIGHATERPEGNEGEHGSESPGDRRGPEEHSVDGKDHERGSGDSSENPGPDSSGRSSPDSRSEVPSERGDGGPSGADGGHSQDSADAGPDSGSDSYD